MDMIERDRKLVASMAVNGPMPLQYMEENMRWYHQRAKYYEDLLVSAKRPEAFRNKKDRVAQEHRIKHWEVMALRMRALGQAAAENCANYSHAKIQSVSVGGAGKNKPIVLLLKGADARL